MRLTKKDGRELARALEAEVPADYDAVYRPRDKISPTDPAWILTSDGARRHLVLGRFGFAQPGKRRVLINARAETVHRLPAFRDAFVRRRCLVPVDGFYEWVGEKGHRRPLVFHRQDGGVLLLYGVYQEEVDEKTGEHRVAFTVLTTPPNEVVARAHDRMPALTTLDAPGAERWLSPNRPGHFTAAGLLELLTPAPDGLLVGDELPRRDSPPRPPIRLPRKAPTSATESGASPQRKATRGEQLKLL